MPYAALQPVAKRDSRPGAGDADRCPWPARRFRIGGIGISAYVAHGAGRPVIFLHGNSSTKAVWSNQLAMLRRCGRAFAAPDLPGHGESEDAATPEATYSFPGYAAVVHGVADALGWHDFDLVGWSLGGHIGLELLATARGARSLLIVGTPPVRLCAAALHEAFYADEDMQLAGKADFTAGDAIAYGTAMMGAGGLTPELMRFIRRTDGNARKFMFANALRGVGVDQRGLVENSAKPLCVVHGEQEPFVRLDYLRSLSYRALWREQICVVPGAGHAPHCQRPAEFNTILADFLGLPNDLADDPGDPH